VEVPFVVENGLQKRHEVVQIQRRPTTTVDVENIDEVSDFRREFCTTRPNNTQVWNDTKIPVLIVDLGFEQ
jgi:hypothetical protein